jgi:hypothetical protein
MKIFSSILALMFFSFAFVQLNDPDPVLWIIIYLSMAAICILAIFNKYYKIVMVILAVGYLIYGIILFPGLLEWLQTENKSLLFDDIAKMQHLYIEESREFLGLVICLAVLTVYWFRSTNLKSPVS